MIPAFIIHNKSCSERVGLVANLQQKTGAIVVDAEMLPNPVEGCFKSHLKVAQLAKQLYPNEHYLVFEDDCILEEGWDSILKQFSQGDLVYVGYTDMCDKTIFGTHGMYISPHLRDILLFHWDEYIYAVQFPWAADWIIPRICKDYEMIVCRPPYHDRDRWCYQKKGLKSMITGKLRK